MTTNDTTKNDVTLFRESDGSVWAAMNDERTAYLFNGTEWRASSFTGKEIHDLEGLQRFTPFQQAAFLAKHPLPESFYAPSPQPTEQPKDAMADLETFLAYMDDTDTTFDRKDYKWDGKVDVRDLDLVFHEKSKTAEERRHHASRAIADNHLAPNELAEQQRFSFEEETYSRAGLQILQRLAHG